MPRDIARNSGSSTAAECTSDPTAASHQLIKSANFVNSF
jgi:hypothetical protein